MKILKNSHPLKLSALLLLISLSAIAEINPVESKLPQDNQINKTQSTNQIATTPLIQRLTDQPAIKTNPSLKAVSNQLPTQKTLDTGKTAHANHHGIQPETLNNPVLKDAAGQHPLIRQHEPKNAAIHPTQTPGNPLEAGILQILEEERQRAELIKQTHIEVDTNVDDIQMEEKMIKEGETKKLKMFLYQRRKFDMGKELDINLNFGFDLEKRVSGDALRFHPDLGFDKVLVNLNSGECLEENQCSKSEDGKRVEAKYDTKEYWYYNGTTFLGVQRVRPGELASGEEHNLDHFFGMPIRFYDNTGEFSRNIVGLGPNSVVWGYWAKVYNFPNEAINLTLCYYKDHEYILFDSKIDFEKEIILKVPKKNDMYKFPGELDFKARGSNKPLHDTEVSLCINNKANLTMRVTPLLMKLIRNSLCKDPSQCSRESDLKNEELDFKLRFYDYSKENSFFAAKFFVSSFVEVHKGDLLWKVDRLSQKEVDMGCQIVLEQEFLKEKYLMISYDLRDPDSLFIGFRIMKASDFSTFDFYFYSLMLFLVLTIGSLVLFIILSYKINRFIDKEEKDKQRLLQEAED